MRDYYTVFQLGAVTLLTAWNIAVLCRKSVNVNSSFSDRCGLSPPQAKSCLFREIRESFQAGSAPDPRCQDAASCYLILAVRPQPYEAVLSDRCCRLCRGNRSPIASRRWYHSDILSHFYPNVERRYYFVKTLGLIDSIFHV